MREIGTFSMDEIVVNRMIYTDISTVGDFTLLGKPLCNSIELSCRRGDEKGLRAIPPGRYRIIINESPRLKRLTPRLIDVPGREGILIHSANRAEELDGCIAPGIYDPSSPDFVSSSRKYFEIIMNELAAVKGEMHITITGGRKF